jgi:hypothetical protein
MLCAAALAPLCGWAARPATAAADATTDPARAAIEGKVVVAYYNEFLIVKADKEYAVVRLKKNTGR